MVFHDFPTCLGKSGCRSRPPPQDMCRPKPKRLLHEQGRAGWQTKGEGGTGAGTLIALQNWSQDVSLLPSRQGTSSSGSQLLGRSFVGGVNSTKLRRLSRRSNARVTLPLIDSPINCVSLSMSYGGLRCGFSFRYLHAASKPQCRTQSLPSTLPERKQLITSDSL